MFFLGKVVISFTDREHKQKNKCHGRTEEEESASHVRYIQGIWKKPPFFSHRTYPNLDYSSYLLFSLKFCTIFAQFGKYICPTISNSPAMVCLRDRCCTMLKWNTNLFPVRKGPPTAKWSPILHIQHILIKILSFKDLFDFLPPIKYRISDSINVLCCIFGFFIT